MKYKDFKTSKGDFLLIEGDNLDYDVIHDSRFKHPMYELFEKFEQLTEEQAKQIVDNIKSGTVLGKLVTKLDDERIDIYTHEGTSTRFLRAINCLLSLLKANDVHFDNPYGMPTPMDYAPYCHMEGGNTISAMSEDDWIRYESDKKEWQDAQSKAWNKSNTYLFKKI